MGFSGTVLKGFHSFLEKRSQRFLVNHMLSLPSPNPIGVHQGLTLSPSLFNLYIEPLTEVLQQANISFHMYADDTAVYEDHIA